MTIQRIEYRKTEILWFDLSHFTKKDREQNKLLNFVNNFKSFEYTFDHL